MINAPNVVRNVISYILAYDNVNALNDTGLTSCIIFRRKFKQIGSPIGLRFVLKMTEDTNLDQTDIYQGIDLMIYVQFYHSANLIQIWKQICTWWDGDVSFKGIG